MSELWEEPVTEFPSSLTLDNHINELSSGDDVSDDWSGNLAEDMVGNLFSLDESWDYSDGEGGKTEEDIVAPQLSLTQQETIRLYHLRQHLDKLRGNIDNHKKKVSKLRNELSACQQKQPSLLKELYDLEVQVGESRTACLGMLYGKEKRLKAQIETKRKDEVNIKNALCTAETELLVAEAAAKQYTELEEVLNRGEAAMKGAKDVKLVQRLQAESRLVVKARMNEKGNRHADKLEAERSTLKEGIDLGKQRKAAMQRVLAHQRASLERAKEDHSQHLEKRMRAILNLKKNIAVSEDTIQAQSLLHREREQRKEEEEMRRLLAQGEDVEVEAVRKKRTQQFQAKLDKFQKKQQQRKVEIVARLLREEHTLKHTLKHTAPEPGHHTVRDTHLKRRKRREEEEEEDVKMSCSTSTTAGKTTVDSLQFIQTRQRDREEVAEFKNIPPGKVVSSLGLSSSAGDGMQPEIRGLWEEAADKPPSIRMTQSEGGDGGGDGGGLVRKKAVNKTEVCMMQTAMEKLKESIIRKQVAAGREFKGIAFNSHPAEVSFLDFEVGKTYKKKVKLTNISYTINYCKLQGISSSLADMVTVNFDPPGSMSAGMACHMLVIFQPQLEEDLEGCVQLLSETGPFNVPVQCRTRKCAVKLQEGHKQVLFDPVCVGEIAKHHVTIHNTGALSTLYTVTLMPADIPRGIVGDETGTLLGLHELPEPSELRNKLLNKSELSVMTDVGVYRGSATKNGKSICSEAKSKSASTLSVYFATPTHEDGVGQGGVITAEKEPANDGEGAEDMTESGWFGPGSPDHSLCSNPLPSDRENQEHGVSLAAIRVGGDSQGVLDGFSSQQIQFLFSPITPTRHEAKFFINFSHTTTPTLEVGVAGWGVAVPVYLEQDEVDLQICLLDRLYQWPIRLHNRAQTARMVTFKVPSDLQAHLEVLPGYSLVQGKASLDAQLKFHPRHALHQSGPIRDKYMTSDGRWSMVVEVEVGGQKHLLSLKVFSRVCPSALVLSPDIVEFGTCTTHETVISTISLNNTSALPQSYGFVHLPPYLDVQPGDGFGEIFPEEILHVDLLFSPEKSKDYEFEIVCKSGLDQTCKVECKGRGVLPPLILSANHLCFPPTGLGNTSTASFSLTYSQLSKLNSAAIRGACPAKGSRAFHFCIPPLCPLALSPHVGLLGPGQSVRIEAHFSPRVTDSMVEQEAVRLQAIKGSVVPARSEAEKRVDISASPPNSRKKKAVVRRGNVATGASLLSSKSSLTSCSSVQLQQHQQLPSSEESTASSKFQPNREQLLLTPRSDAWCEAYYSLLTCYANTQLTVDVPCFISNATPSEHNIYDHTHLTPQSDYTVYLEVSGITVKPDLVLAKDHSPTIDFGTVGTGEVAKRCVKVQNISAEQLCIHSSALDPLGPFTLRNALRDFSPHTTHTLLLQFSPQGGSKSYDRLLLYYGKEGSYLELHLVGKGVHVNVSLGLPETPEVVHGGGVQGELTCVDLGNVLVRDGASKSLNLTNHTSIPIHFKLRLSSQLPHNRHVKKLRGMCASGRPAFSCVPCEGTVERDQVKVVKVTFDPDRQSSYYTDKLLVEYNGQLYTELQVMGRAWMNTLYVSVSENASAPTNLNDSISLFDTTESLCCPMTLVHSPSSSSSSSSSSSYSNNLPSQPLLIVFLYSILDQQQPGGAQREHRTGDLKREIVIGCIKSSLLKKQSGEFNIEPLVGVVNPMTKCFIIEPHKASVEAGRTRTVSITFTPPKELTSCIEGNFTLTLKGESLQVIQLMLRVLIAAE